MHCFEAEQDGCQSQSWMGCSYLQPIRELFINATANQDNPCFAHSNMDFITATYAANSARYVKHGQQHPTPNEILAELQVCHEIAKLLSVQMVAGVCVCLCQWGKKREDRVAQEIKRASVIVTTLSINLAENRFWCCYLATYGRGIYHDMCQMTVF